MKRKTICMIIWLTYIFAGIASADLNNGLVAYYPFNGNAKDESGNGNDGVVNGAALTKDRFGIDNSSYNFDGVNDYIEVANSNSLNPDYISISVWVNPKVNNTTSPVVMKYRSTPTEASYWFYLYTNGVKGPRFRVEASNGIGDAGITELIETNKWTHIVGTYGGNEAILYINGNLVKTNFAGGTLKSNTLPLRIGGSTENIMSYFNGKIDEVRIYNRKLTADEIELLYNDAPPNNNTEPDLNNGMVAYYPFNGDSKDESGNGNDGVVNGAALTKDRFGIDNSAYNFDGENNYIEVANSNSLNPDYISISAWVNPTINNNDSPVVTKYRSANGDRSYWLYIYTSGIKGPRFRVYTSHGIADAAITELIETNKWSHIVGTYGGNEAMLYINGKLVKTSSVSGSLRSNSLPLRIGASTENTMTYFNGKIDEVRIYNRKLTGEEIELLNNSAPTYKPDLIITSLNVLSFSNGTINYTFSIKNIGKSNYTFHENDNNISVQAFLSEDNEYDQYDDSVLINNIILSDDFKTDESLSFEYTINSLDIDNLSTPYLILLIDSGNHIDESDEDNNTFFSSISEGILKISLAFSAPSITVTEGNQPIQYTIKPDINPLKTFWVNIAADNKKLIIEPSNVEFRSDNWKTPQIINVTAFDNYIVEDDIQTFITHTISGENIEAIEKNPIVNVNIVDNDLAGLTISDPDDEISEGGSDRTLILKLSSCPTSDIKLEIKTDEQLYVLDNSIIFTSESCSTPPTKNIKINAVDDQLYETAHEGKIEITASADDMIYSGIIKEKIFIIKDNDRNSYTNCIYVPEDYATIQEALNAASEGYTVIVTPGRYTENIIWPSVDGIKLIGGGEDKTIIDGGSNGSVITFKFDNELISSQTLIKNIKIEKGYAQSGGGIYCLNSHPSLLNIKIINNSAKDIGGGIYSNNSNLHMSNVTITNNTSENFAGGLYSYNSTINFDTENRCNIYSNFSFSTAKDLYSNKSLKINLNKFTVQKPTGLYACPIENFTFDIKEGILPQITSNLYVSPSGDNSNSGVSIDKPLKTIHYALSVLAANQNNSFSIILDSGTYSPETNGEQFPLVLFDYVSIKGNGINHCTLDANETDYVFVFDTVKNCSIDGFIISNANSSNSFNVNAGVYCNESVIDFSNIKVSNNKGSGIFCYSSTLYISDSIITLNSDYGIMGFRSTFDISDTVISNNSGGLYLSHDSRLVFNNGTISENTAYNGGGIYSKNSKLYMFGAEISKNSAQNGGGLYLHDSKFVCSKYKRNSIFLNKATENGNDLYASTDGVIELYLQYFSVSEPKEVHAYPIDKYSFDILESIGRTVNVPSDYSTIQEALNTVSEGDTIIVSPGKYKENILWPMVDGIKLIGEDAENTVIDGGENGSVIKFNFNDEVISSQTLIKNFQIKNGKAESGGGIYCLKSHPSLSNITIINNSAQDSGGGIYSNNSNLNLSNVTITSNTAKKHGGGLYCYNSIMYFDFKNRCNIYSNVSFSSAKDIYSDKPIELFLDKFTVIKPTGLYACPIDNFTCDIKEGLLPQTNSNLYVSPLGNDSNSGISMNEPLKTIDYALTVIAANQNNSYTIFLDSGTYSPNTNGEKFPLVLFDYVSIKGNGINQSILDANKTDYVLIFDKVKNCIIDGLTVSNGDGSNYYECGIYSYDSKFTLSNLKINHNNGSGIFSIGSDFVLSDAIITANTDYGIRSFASNLIMLNTLVSKNKGGMYVADNSTLHLKNGVISENSSSYGGGIFSRNSELFIKDVEIVKNTAQKGGGVYIVNSTTVNFSNTTISMNYATYDGGGIYFNSCSSKIVNSILYYNHPQSLYLWDFNDQNHLTTILYSNIENGLDGIIDHPKYKIDWQEGNISIDPLFTNINENYNLQFNSPCINTGHPDFDNDGQTYETDEDDQDPDGTRMDMGALYYYLYSSFSLDIPERIREDKGTLEKKGKISINSINQNDIIVNLSSNELSRLNLPNSIIISAGSTSAYFDISVINNNEYNMPIPVLISASIANRGIINKTITIEDDDLMVRIISPDDQSPFDEDLIYVQGDANDKMNDIARIELIVSNSTGNKYSGVKNYNNTENSVSWGFNISNEEWIIDGVLYTITAIAYNSIGYSCSTSIQYGMVDSEITCDISKNQVIIGESISVSGLILPSLESMTEVTIEVCYDEDDTCFYFYDNTDQEGKFSTLVSLKKAGLCSIKSKWDGKKRYKPDVSNAIDLMVQKGYPLLKTKASSYQIKTNEKISIDGVLEYKVREMHGLIDKTIIIKMTNSNMHEYTYTVETEDSYGSYELKNLDKFSEPDNWTIQAIFEGTDDYAPCKSEAITINVLDSAGYAIIVPGHGQDIDLYTKTTDFIYYQLKQRGFFDEDIQYFNYQQVIDIPTQSAIRKSITDRLHDKYIENLYIILVGHGSEDNFDVPEGKNLDDDNTITSTELNDWITEIQNTANPSKIIVILGFCNSGSFIDELSGKNRIIITSAAEDEYSYKGLIELDKNFNNLRDGEYFTSEFFRQFSLGQSIKDAFEVAVKFTEKYSFAGIETKYPFFDHSLQHPLLDDNEDGIGSNDLSDPNGDGKLCESTYLGTKVYSEAIQNIPIKRVADTIFLNTDEKIQLSSIWAEIDSESLAKLSITGPADLTRLTVRAQVKYHKSGDTGEDIMNSLGSFYDLTYDKEQNHFYCSKCPGFKEPGMYQVFYYAIYKTLEGQIATSSLMETRLYRAIPQNSAPSTPELISPVNIVDYSTENIIDDTTVQAPLLLNWKHATDDIDDYISYSVRIYTKNPTIDIERINNITNNYIITKKISSDVLYYWQVRAIDQWGAISESNVWGFKVLNMSNEIPGEITLKLIDFNNKDTFIDNAEILIDYEKEIKSMNGGGNYCNASISKGSYDISIEADDYFYTIIQVDINKNEHVEKTIEMIPIVPGDININAQIDIGDVVAWLELLNNNPKPFFTASEIYQPMGMQDIKIQTTTSFPVVVDVNGDNISGYSELIYTLQQLSY